MTSAIAPGRTASPGYAPAMADETPPSRPARAPGAKRARHKRWTRIATVVTVVALASFVGAVGFLAFGGSSDDGDPRVVGTHKFMAAIAEEVRAFAGRTGRLPTDLG